MIYVCLGKKAEGGQMPLFSALLPVLAHLAKVHPGLLWVKAIAHSQERSQALKSPPLDLSQVAPSVREASGTLSGLLPRCTGTQEKPNSITSAAKEVFHSSPDWLGLVFKYSSTL